MKKIFRRLIIGAVKTYGRKKEAKDSLNQLGFAREVKEFKVSIVYFLKDALFIILGIFSAAFGLKGFLLPSNFIDGGATGIALLISQLTSISLAVLLVVINIPFMILGYSTIGKQFVIKASAAIAGLAIVVATVHFPAITYDKLLVSVFGGFFLGAGIGLTVRGGGVLDGTEVLAIAISKKLGTTIGDVIIMINGLVFCSAAYFLSLETAFYSMITYLSASKHLILLLKG